MCMSVCWQTGEFINCVIDIQMSSQSAFIRLLVCNKPIQVKSSATVITQHSENTALYFSQWYLIISRSMT